jgi:hypothetical protein
MPRDTMRAEGRYQTVIEPGVPDRVLGTYRRREIFAMIRASVSRFVP